jgi:hypothetical protein
MKTKGHVSFDWAELSSAMIYILLVKFKIVAFVVGKYF